MEHFPILSRTPTTRSVGRAIDPTIRTEFESGHSLSRPRFTRIRKKWTLGYNFLTAADKVALESLEETVVVGGDTFGWESDDVNDIKTYEVRMAAPLDFHSELRLPGTYSVTITLTEA